jgi:hypothetical protein
MVMPKQVWAIYCERFGGWLVDTSYVWAFDVAQCAEFANGVEALGAIIAMYDNGHTGLATADGRGVPADVHIVRIR